MTSQLKKTESLWLTTGVPAAVLLFVWFWVFRAAIYSAVEIWIVSKTFNHCFLVLPGAVYLAWQERSRFLLEAPRANYWLLLPLCMVLVLGLLGDAGNVQLFTHVAAFTVLPLVVWLLLGNRIAIILWFPLAFILFSIPFGDELIPFFQQITANMAVKMLGWVGIPVFRNGLYLDIPEGRFVVAEACSGVRFLIAMVVFGAVYSHVGFRSPLRKSLIMLIAVLLPVIANSIRVFGIILVAHFSKMKYAIGADHLVYGWVFFAVVLLAFIAIGELWRDRPVHEPVRNITEINPAWQQRNWWKPVLAAAIPLLLYMLWQHQLSSINGEGADRIVREALPEMSEYQNRYNNWLPEFSGATDVLHAKLGDSEESAPELYLAWYKQNISGAELISYANRLYSVERWSLISGASMRLAIDQNELAVRRLHITATTGEERLIIYWYELPRVTATRTVMVKWWQALDRLSGNSGAGAMIALSIPSAGNAAEAERVLSDYIKQHYDEIRAAVPFGK